MTGDNWEAEERLSVEGMGKQRDDDAVAESAHIATSVSTASPRKPIERSLPVCGNQPSLCNILSS